MELCQCKSTIDFLSLRNKIAISRELVVRVASGSMEPVLPTGTILTISPIDSVSHLAPFDVIVFWDGSRLTCHYFVGLSQAKSRASSSPNMIITRGLRNTKADFPVPETDILGRAADVRLPWWIRAREVFKWALR